MYHRELQVSCRIYTYLDLKFESSNLTIWKELKLLLLKSKHHDLAIDKVSYREFLERCTLISKLKDPTIRFVKKY